MPHHFDRRDLLAGLLGLPLAAMAGCGRSAPWLPPAGEIVGANQTLGHRLRSPLTVELRAEQFQPVEVAIVGGGIAGLSAARKLKLAGVEDFVVLELEDVVGGTSRSGQTGGLAYPWGAHYLPAPMKENAPLVKLLDDFGVVTGYEDDGTPQFAEEMLCRDPGERLFLAGQWHEGLWPAALATEEDNSNLQQFQRAVERWAAWRDGQGRRAFVLPLSACSDDADVVALDKQSFAAWLDERSLTSPRFRWWVEYAMRDDYGLTLAQTSAWAGLFYFAARVATKATEPQPLLTWPEGNGWLVKQLKASVAAHVKTGQAVAKIEAHAEGEAKLVALTADGSAHGYRARHVIFAAPHFLAPYVMRDFPAARRTDTKSFPYGAWLVANLSLKGRPVNRGFEPAWDSVLYDGAGLGYVSATHQRGRDQGPTVWTYYYPLTDDDPAAARTRLLEQDWSAWANFVLTDLRMAHNDLPALVERLDVMRWGHAMIQPRVGFISGAARQREAQPWHNVHFAHSDLSGLALFEEAFDRGLRAADSVLTARRPS
jgi:protoporphyrinogen oxidase